jgi:hypothetical protein
MMILSPENQDSQQIDGQLNVKVGVVVVIVACYCYIGGGGCSFGYSCWRRLIRHHQHHCAIEGG